MARSARLSRREHDRHILEQFVGIYCEGRHGSAKGHLCDACRDLLAYSLQRYERCPHDPKPSCKRCKTHCYRPAYRERVRQVMRYSGMRMLLKGRLDLLRHYFL
jgi:hypothetical protein